MLMMLAAGVVLIALVLYWILDKYLAFKLAESYVNRIAYVLDINDHLATAITIVVAVVLAGLIGLIFTFDKKKRWLGIGGVVALLFANSMVLWIATRDFGVDRSGAALKCFFFDGARVEYGERPGIDPRTGRTCRAVTPEILWRLREYEKGRKPQLMQGGDIVFFDPRSGEPVIWFSRSRNRLIELFDLMGFHPETGAELAPVTRDVVAEWHEQRVRIEKDARSREQASRPPQRVNEVGLIFFDPVTGSPKVWYWRDGAGNYEFFDNLGFHPVTGERLEPVTKEVVTEWQRLKAERERTDRETRERQEREAAEAIAREKERQAREEGERLEREAKRRRIQEAIDERERQEKREKDVEQRRQREAANECDRLASNPNDRKRNLEVSGVPFMILRGHAQAAVRACEAAMTIFPHESRLKYQLARAYQTFDPRKAREILTQLVSEPYPAAFDNLGSLFRDGRAGRIDNQAAVRYFRQGAELDDPDSMFSLAGMLNDSTIGTPSPQDALHWYTMAAQSGHQDAAVEAEKLAATLQQQERNKEMFREFFDHFLRRISR